MLEAVIASKVINFMPHLRNNRIVAFVKWRKPPKVGLLALLGTFR